MKAEDKHAEEYLSFLDYTMSIPSECMWYNPVSNKQFMSVDIYALPFSIKGTADVVVTKKAFVKTWNVEILESSADLCHAITIFKNALGGPEDVRIASVINESNFHIARHRMDSVKSNEDSDDVANMSDVFDMMTPEEILKWKLKRVPKLLAKNPSLQNIMLSRDVIS
ncbi:20249_t:CDS:2 [Gigaspora rosea]|nr:20249_t:CDS:2 [Gigaspora rosea]